MGWTMTSTRRALKAMISLLPLGALGISAALAAAPPKPMAMTSQNPAPADVAGQLQAIRNAVSQMTTEQAELEPDDPNIQKVWWGNWRPRWFNGGWRNGGWRNGGWNNGWGNGGWNNWHNFWRNW